jgi:hypothetical protein
MRARAYWVALTLAGLSFAIPGWSRAESITNGSFETGNFTFDGNGAASLPLGSTAISGWTTFGGELAVLENANAFGLTTPFGTQFLDLTGYHDSSPYGGVLQMINTTVGQSYVLSLDLGVDNSSSLYSAPVSVSAQAAGSVMTFTANPTGTGNIWTPFSLAFTAVSTTTTISIQGTGAKQYLGLDNVSVNPSAVPEPTSLVMGGTAAIVGLCFWSRRRGSPAA